MSRGSLTLAIIATTHQQNTMVTISTIWSLMLLTLTLFLIHINGTMGGSVSKQPQLWLDCSCLHVNERNASNWGALTLNASQARGAKNNCLMIFIGGQPDELVAFQLQQLQLRSNGCLDTVEVFPYLRDPVIENSTQAAYAWCGNQRPPNTTIYSANRLLGLRLSFRQPPPANETWLMQLMANYRFLKRALFKTEGRLVPHSFCDFYFFASTERAVPAGGGGGGWRYFHSPLFPANYPAHIKCAYKFIGRPDSRVELRLEELQLPPVASGGCQLDALTIFDAESAHMSAVIDVLCSASPSYRIVSSGPDLLIEFNASSNRTGKGFRGSYRFVTNEQVVPTSAVTLKQQKPQQQQQEHPQPNQEHTTISEGDGDTSNFITGENCRHTFDSRVNKSGTFESNQLTGALFSAVNNNDNGARIVQCRYEFRAQDDERIQIKFHDFNIPTESQNSSVCQQNHALQLLNEVRGKFESVELMCGAFLPKPIMSTGSQLHLQFIGKYPPAMTNKVQYYGFRAEYRFLKNFGIMSGAQIGHDCSFIYNSSIRISGLFSSPNFPGNYVENLVCNYYFYGGDTERVVIRFTFFDVEGIGNCDYQTASDYVEFSNFMSTDRKYSKYCGKLQNFELRSDGRFFRVTFHSNDRFVAIGFRGVYTFESAVPDPLVTDTSMQSYISNGARMKNIYLISQIIILILFCSDIHSNFN